MRKLTLQVVTLPKSLLVVTVLAALFVDTAPSLAGTYAPLWSHRIGGVSDENEIHVAYDPSGNIVFAGDFSGTVNMGGGDLVSVGNTDIVLAKFNAAGVHQWSQRFGDGNTQFAYAVTTDLSGNVIVVGSFDGFLDFGPGPLVSAGSFDIYVAKFNSYGVHQWSQRFGDASDQYAYTVATDAAGNVFVGGTMTGTVNFGGGNLVALGYDAYVAKFSATGVHQWSQRYGDANVQILASLATDNAANVIMAGRFAGTANFGGGNLTSAGAYDAFLAKLNGAGVHQWSQRFGDASQQLGGPVATDASGNIGLTGGFAGTINLGGGPLVSLGDGDVFLAKFNSAGVHQWSKRFGDATDQYASGLAADAQGNWVLSGDFLGSINLGGATLFAVGSYYDTFISKFNSAGAHVWSAAWVGPQDQYSLTLAVGPTGSTCVGGYFLGSANVGGAYLSSAGGYDWYLTSIAGGFVEPSILKIVDVGNDQGRQVRIRFTRSGEDDPAAANPVERYDAYRRIDPLPAGAPASANPSLVVPLRDVLAAPGWVFAGSVPAHGKSEYYMTAPTAADSTILGMYRSVFFVTAATASPSIYFESPPDSGYSVDNLAPGAPTSFVYGSGLLKWDESTAEDFDYFSVYGSNTMSFASATLIDYTVATLMDVSGSPYTYYFATATDFAGNEGKPAMVNTLSDAGTPRSYVLSISSYPNPFNPRTTIRYTLPSKGRVAIDVYDARGERVASLLDEEKPAGAYTLPWDGSDDNGARVSSGLYFARVTHASGTKSYKMVLLK